MSLLDEFLNSSPKAVRKPAPQRSVMDDFLASGPVGPPVPEFVQTPGGGRQSFASYQAEQAYAQQSAARAREAGQALTTMGPGPMKIEPTVAGRAGFSSEHVRDVRDPGGVVGRFLDVLKNPFVRVANLGRQMGFESGQGKSAVSAGFNATLEGAGRDFQAVQKSPLGGTLGLMNVPNAALQATLDPAIRHYHGMPQRDDTWSELFNRGMQGEGVASETLTEAVPQLPPGSIPDWLGGAKREESINNALQSTYALGATGIDLLDVDTLTGLGALATAGNKLARMRALKSLGVSVPEAEMAAMTRAAQREAVASEMRGVQRTMEAADKLGMQSPSARLVTDPALQARVQRLAEDQTTRPLANLRQTEEMLAPVGPPKPGGGKSAFQLRRELQQAKKGGLLDEFLATVPEEAPSARAAGDLVDQVEQPTPGPQASTGLPSWVPPRASELPDSIITAFADMQPADGGLLPLSRFTEEEANALRAAGLVDTATTSTGSTYEGVNDAFLWEVRNQRFKQRMANRVPAPAAAAAPTLLDEFLQQAEPEPPRPSTLSPEPEFDPSDFPDAPPGFVEEMQSRSRSIPELREESERRLAAHAAKNPPKEYPVPDRPVTLEEFSQARDVLREWQNRPEVRQALPRGVDLDRPDIRAMMPPEVAAARDTERFWYGQRQANPEAHAAAVRAAETELGGVLAPEANPKRRLKAGTVAEDARGAYVDMGQRRYRLTPQDAERYQRLPAAGIDQVEWLKTRASEPKPKGPRPGLDFTEEASEPGAPRPDLIRSDQLPEQVPPPRRALTETFHPSEPVEPRNNQSTVLGGNTGEEMSVSEAFDRMRDNQVRVHSEVHRIATENHLRLHSIGDVIHTADHVPGPSVMVEVRHFDDVDDVLRAAAELRDSQGYRQVDVWFEGKQRPPLEMNELVGGARHSFLVQAYETNHAELANLLGSAGIGKHFLEELSGGELRVTQFVTARQDTDGLFRSFESVADRFGAPVHTEPGWLYERPEHGALQGHGGVRGPSGTPESGPSGPRQRPEEGGHHGPAGQSGAGPSAQELRRRLEPEPAEPAPRVGQDTSAPEGAPQEPLPSYTHNGEKVELGGIEAVQIPLAGMVKLIKQITGQVPDVAHGLLELSKRMGGEVRGRVQRRLIQLNPKIFRDPALAAKVAGHEIGHLPDWVPNLSPETIAGKLQGLRRQMRSHFKGMAGELRDELLQLSKWWRPYDEAKATPGFKSYRADPEELFADAMSVLLNSPAELRARAPKFFKSFGEMLNNNQMLQQALKDVYEGLSGTMDDLVEDVGGRIRAPWANGIELIDELEQAAQARKLSFWERQRQQWQAIYDKGADIYDKVTLEFGDRGSKIKRRAQQAENEGIVIPEDLDPRLTFDQFNMGNNKTWVATSDWGENVVDILEGAELGDVKLAEYMMDKAAVDGSLRGVALPEGWTSDLAERRLSAMRAKLRPEQLQALEKAARGARDVFYKALEDGVEAGTIPRDLFDELQANRDSFVPMMRIQEMKGKIPDEIRQQTRGTLGEIKNPVTALFYDALELHNLNTQNHAKLRQVQFAQLVDDPVHELAEGVKAPKGMEEMTVWQNGQTKRYAVDPYIAEAFKRLDVGFLKMITNAMTALDNTIFKPLWIGFSPAFHGVSFLRDMQRYAGNMATLGPHRWWDPIILVKTIKDYWQVRKSALAYALNESELAKMGMKPDEIQAAKAEVRQAIDEFVILPPEDSMASRILRGTSSNNELLSRWLKPDAEKAKRGLISEVIRKMEQAGRVLESTSKLAANRRLLDSGQSTLERARDVRDYFGMPNTTIGGRMTPVTGKLFMFSNVALQGWKSELRLMTQPKTRVGKMMQMFQQHMWHKMVLGLGLAGIFGAQVKKALEGIPENDRQNSIVIPIPAFLAGGKLGEIMTVQGGEYGQATAYIPIPEDPTGKFFGNIAYQLTKRLAGADQRALEQTAYDLLKSVLDEIPGVSPSIELMRNTARIMSGENPTDSFGKPILSQSQQDAGGWPRFKGYGLWALGQLGPAGRALSKQIGPYRPTREVDSMLGGLIKVSDAGYREQQRLAQQLETSARARKKESYGAKTRYLYDERNRLEKLSGARTPAQQNAYLYTKAFETQLKMVDDQVAQLEAAGKHRQAQALRQKFEYAVSQKMADQYNRLLGRK